MHDLQGLIFRSASHWPGATALVVLSVGLLYTLQGFRFARFLLAVSCAGGGFALGTILAALLNLPPIVPIITAAGLGAGALARSRLAVPLASAFTLAALAQYLAAQLHQSPTVVWIAGGLGLPAGFSLKWVCRRTLPILVTIVQGAGLLVLGFVGITNAVVPSLGETFVDCAARYALLVPGLMLILCVLGYSVQANALQGDIESGGNPGWNDLEAS